MSNSSHSDKRKQQQHFKKAAERMFAGADATIFKRAAELRNQPTHAEEVLWSHLRTKPHGFKFRRQHPYLNYILDFYCHALRLVIEADGSVHNNEDVKQHDDIRQKQLEDHGLTVLRFTNDDIEIRLESVVSKIEHYLILKTKPSGGSTL